jgi:hypothetical protein
LARTIWTARFAAAAAAVVLVGTVALAFGAGGFGRAIVGGPQPSTTASPVSAASSPSPAPRATPMITGAKLDGTVSATGVTYHVRHPQVSGLADPAVAATTNSRLRDQEQGAIGDRDHGHRPDDDETRIQRPNARQNRAQVVVAHDGHAARPRPWDATPRGISSPPRLGSPGRVPRAMVPTEVTRAPRSCGSSGEGRPGRWCRRHSRNFVHEQRAC